MPTYQTHYLFIVCAMNQPSTLYSHFRVFEDQLIKQKGVVESKEKTLFL